MIRLEGINLIAIYVMLLTICGYARIFRFNNVDRHKIYEINERLLCLTCENIRRFWIIVCESIITAINLKRGGIYYRVVIFMYVLYNAKSEFYSFL